MPNISHQIKPNPKEATNFTTRYSTDKRKNAYINLPANLTIDLDKCQTIQDLEKQLSRIRIRCTITIGNQSIPIDNLGEVIFSLGTHKKIEVRIKYDHHKYAYGSVSASSAVNSDERIHKVINETNSYELYLNWFAMEVFDNLKTDDATHDLALKVQSIMEFDNYSSYGRFCNREELYTSALCELFTIFLGDKNHSGTSTHNV